MEAIIEMGSIVTDTFATASTQWISSQEAIDSRSTGN